jgi:serine acetyltransferase
VVNTKAVLQNFELQNGVLAKRWHQLPIRSRARIATRCCVLQVVAIGQACSIGSRCWLRIASNAV